MFNGSDGFISCFGYQKRIGKLNKWQSLHVDHLQYNQLSSIYVASFYFSFKFLLGIEFWGGYIYGALYLDGKNFNQVMMVVCVTDVGSVKLGQETREESFEELQELFKEIFQADIKSFSSIFHTNISPLHLHTCFIIKVLVPLTNIDLASILIPIFKTFVQGLITLYN